MCEVTPKAEREIDRASEPFRLLFTPVGNQDQLKES